MLNPTKRILIESILGGQSPLTNFAAHDQFRSSLGINPALPLDDFQTTFTTGSGLLRPAGSTVYTGTTVNSYPLWIKKTPKDALTYVYDRQGSVYTISGSVVTGLSDGGSMTNSVGNGMDYYDNYAYFAKNTTIARYGPLNGVPTFDGDYWAGTLGKTALTNTTYPDNTGGAITYPNHVMHRHSDGKLYFADVVGNQGYIHYISTTKTTVEGDTDNGSVYQKLQFGYGLWPTAIESYGSSLAIALYEGNPSESNTKSTSAKLAFWDTTSQNFNQITWVEFPDQIITGLKNINGVLYIISGNGNSVGFRVSQYVGGYTVSEVAYFEYGTAPFQGAIDGTADRLLFGSSTTVPSSSGIIYSVGLQKSSLGKGIFSIGRPATTSESQSTIYALTIASNAKLSFSAPTIGWAQTGGVSGYAIGTAGGSGNYSSNYPTVWQSQIFNIGQPFKITKIRIPFAQAIAANMTVTPKIYFDDDIYGTNTSTLTVIDNTAYSGKRSVVLRPQNLTGDHNFYLELKWTGSVVCVVGLPITIEYELIDD